MMELTNDSVYEYVGFPDVVEDVMDYGAGDGGESCEREILRRDTKNRASRCIQRQGKIYTSSIIGNVFMDQVQAVLRSSLLGRSLGFFITLRTGEGLRENYIDKNEF